MAEKKENQRILLTKRLLQEGLLRLLETKDLEKISVTELCREAGINRATFYNHYDSPQSLLADIELNIRAKMEEMVHPPASLSDATDQLEIICTFMKEHNQLFGILRRCHADSDLACLFEQIAQHPTFQQIDGLDSDEIHLMSTYMFTGCFYLIREWLGNNMNKTPREVAELTMRIINKDYRYKK